MNDDRRRILQLLADTGRGVLGRRDPRITIASVRRQIELGAGTPLSFDTAQAGHVHCNRYAMTLVTNGKVYDVLDDKGLFNDILRETARLQFDRQSRSAAVRTFVRGILKNPRLTLRGAYWLIRKLWQAKADLLRARGRVDKLSFFIHNFMDACGLERERIDACAFMAMTQHGPMSMCLHNAKRDTFILAPIKVNTSEGERLWNPLSGEATEKPADVRRPPQPNRKTARGRLRRAATAAVSVAGSVAEDRQECSAQ